jgi:hypothetical protein
MRVKVDKHKQVLKFGVLNDQLFNAPNRGVVLLFRIHVVPIQVVRLRIHAVVTPRNSVWIQHRHDLKHEVLSQMLCLLIL